MPGPQAYWQRFTGQTMAECQGAGWTAAIHPNDLGPTLSAWRDVLVTRRLFDFKHHVRRRDGVYRVCSVRAGPVRDRDGTVREWVGVHEDVTERREAEVALL